MRFLHWHLTKDTEKKNYMKYVTSPLRLVEMLKQTEQKQNRMPLETRQSPVSKGQACRWRLSYLNPAYGRQQ